MDSRRCGAAFGRAGHLESVTYPVEDFLRILADWLGGEEFGEVGKVLAGALGFVLLDLAA